jgi:hypothetical protein
MNNYKFQKNDLVIICNQHPLEGSYHLNEYYGIIVERLRIAKPNMSPLYDVYLQNGKNGKFYESELKKATDDDSKI